MTPLVDGPGIIRDDVASGRGVVGGVHLEWSVACNVGRVREANEDGAVARAGLFLIADGMGGHDCGEIASEIALTVLAEVEAGLGQEDTRDEVEQLLVAAQDEIGEIDTSTERRAGTTLTGAILVEHDDAPHWLVVNIGDSRTYCVRDGVFEQVTVDHSQVQEYLDAGMMTAEQARVDPRRNVITRALGAGMAPPRADFFSFATEPGDQLLLCSDGLTGELPDAELEAVLVESETAQDAADALVEAALVVGAHDNVTVVVVRVLGDDEDESADDDAADDDAVDTADDDDPEDSADDE